jgi:hypothetical protein
VTIPECPAHGPMMKVTIEQGDVIIGYAWFCVRDDRESPDYCDECQDCDEPVPARVGQMSMFEEL